MGRHPKFVFKGEIVKHVVVVVATGLMLIALFSCKNKMGEAVTGAQPQAAQSSGEQPRAADPESSEVTGTVVESLDAGNYTYVRVDTGSKKVWAAAPAFKVKLGEKVVVPAGLLVKSYRSATLKRTFDEVYFVSSVAQAGSNEESSQLPEGHPAVGKDHAAGAAPEKVDFSGIVKPQGGKTVAEIYNQKAALSGKEILVRGKVVKFLTAIMGKNWIHLRDGTGTEGSNDLTVTTEARAKVGDTILVKGLLVTDKDYGFGYHYPVIVENAKITVE